MRLFSKEATRYAVLLICLFGIAVIAVRQVLADLGEHLDGAQYAVIAFSICIITFGFMLIAGAFGLWGMQLAAATESQRRIGRLIDAMDYIQDGLIAIDRKGRITGCNPAVKVITGIEVIPNQTLARQFPCLGEEDIQSILTAREPDELERKFNQPDGAKTLRFRSQPMEGMVLLLVSDVTRMEAQRLHNRLVARLQLIGQIARGVAYDFNNLLCAISGHASLLARLPIDSPDAQRSLRAIGKGAERGTALAAHLLELSTPGPTASFPRMSTDFLQAAISALRDSLPEGWQVDGQINDVPPMTLTGLKIEQVVLNLGLLVADRASSPGTLRIMAAAPRPDVNLLHVSNQYAGVLLVATTPLDAVSQSPATRDDASSAGVIVSVIRTMIEQANGTLEAFHGADGSLIYRVALPRELPSAIDAGRASLAADLAPYVANWNVLLVSPDDRNNQRIHERLRSMSVKVEAADNFMSALVHLEDKRQLDAIIVDQRMIAMESAGLLRAILKLCPTAAIVVLSEEPSSDQARLGGDIVFVRHADSPDRILLAMIEARSLAVKRRQS